MKEKIKFLSLMLAMMLTLVCFTACSSDDDEPSSGNSNGLSETELIGTWTDSDGNKLVLNSNKTGYSHLSGYGTDEFKNWHLEGNQLVGTDTNGSNPGREVLIAIIADFTGSSFRDATDNTIWRKK